MNRRYSGLNELVAINLRLLRRARGLSQEELAEICGLHRTYVGAIERCERNITLSTLEKLAESLDVSPLILLQSPSNNVQ